MRIRKPGGRDWLKVLVFGPPGVGKTLFLGTAQMDPRTANMLLIDWEGGTITLAHAPDPIFQDVDVQSVRSFVEFNDVHEFLYNHAVLRDQYVLAKKENAPHATLEDLSTKLHYISLDPTDYAKETNPDAARIAHAVELARIEEPRLYFSFGIDSLTEVQKLNMYGIVANRVKGKPNSDPDVAQLDDWGKSIEQIRKLVRYFRDLPYHGFFAALSQDSKDERSGIITCKPSMPGKLPEEVCGFLDIVGYLGTSSETVKGETVIKRNMLFQPFDKWVCPKDRTDKLGVFFPQPTIPKMLDAIYGPIDHSREEVN